MSTSYSTYAHLPKKILSSGMRIIVLLFVVFINSCTKYTPVKGDFSVLQVFVAIEGKATVLPNFLGDKPLTSYRESPYLSVSAFGENMHSFFIYNNPQPLAFYNLTDTFPKSSPLVNLNLNLDKGEIYTLFLSGNINAVDTFLIKEQLPTFEVKDSVTAFRFVNLSNDAPISVNLKGEAPGSLVSYLPYRQASPYVNYPIVLTADPYEFEIRDAVTQELLASYKDDEMLDPPTRLGYWLQRSRNLVFFGIRGDISEANMPQVRGLANY